MAVIVGSNGSSDRVTGGRLKSEQIMSQSNLFQRARICIQVTVHVHSRDHGYKEIITMVGTQLLTVVAKQNN